MGIEEIIEKHALKNANDYGKADMGAVIGKVIGEMPESKNDMKSLVPKVKDIIAKVNKMSKKDIEDKLSAHSFVEKPKEEERRIRLPPHPEGRVVTRFAPEPSGYMHIGHAKAALISWLGAKESNGRFIIRFDDTNPELAKQEFVDGAKDGLKWLGIKWQVETYTSDFMQLFYIDAFELIKRGKAYICECTPELIKLNRRERRPCACRNKVEMRNTSDFDRMTTGGFDEGKAVLRYKGDMRALNTVMRDPTLIRLVNKSHFRQEDRYVAWPLYDFVTPILDAIQGITHAVRSKEYELRDELYYALIRDLELRKPMMLSISRMLVKNNPTQKRVIRKAVQEGLVKTWDDPRLMTIVGIRRRGIQPEALREFALSFGAISTSESKEGTLEPLLHANRKLLDPESRRLHFVKDPITVTIKGLDSSIDLAFHPDNKELGSRKLSVKEKVLLSKDDVKKGETIRLRDLCNIKITAVDGGSATAELVKSKEMPEKKVQWVPVEGAVELTVERPGDLMDGEELNKNGLAVENGAAEPAARDVKTGGIVQFVRYGFVRKDRSEKGKPVFIFSC